MINSFLGVTVSANSSLPPPSNDDLVSVLTGGTLTVWSVKGILAAAPSVKYAILHKIGITHWFPACHASSVSPALATFLYRIGTGSFVDVGLFIYSHLLWHIGTFCVKIPIALPRFFSSLLLHLQPNILTSTDAPGTRARTLSLSY